MKKKFVTSTIAVTALSLATVSGLSTVAIANAQNDDKNKEEDTKASDTQDTIDAVENNDTVNKVKETISTTSDSNADKEETVYVSAKADGSTKEIIVSDWLKNKEGASTLNDISDLLDIENVKGYEEFVQNSDGTITWNAGGEDIYYQGKSSKELPISVKITYTVDGKEVPASEMAGKSGKVTMRFDYTNHSCQTMKVNGVDTTIYTPFVTVTGMILPSDTFRNVEVSNGKVISDGSNLVVVGMAMAGLSDSLHLDADSDIDIPDYVEVTADVTDFALETTATIVTPDLLSEIDIDNMESLDDLESSLNELTDASKQLVDGTGELKNGSQELKDGSKELADGTTTLKDGTSQLKSGAGTLQDGASKLWSGSVVLKDGTAELKQGASDLLDGAGTLKKGTSDLKDGAADLKQGTSDLLDGAGTLKKGTSDLKDGASALKKGTADLKTGVDTLKTGTSQIKTGASKLSSGTTDLSAGADSLKEGTAQLVTGSATLYTGIQSLNAGLSSAKSGADQLIAGYEGGVVAGAQNLANGLTQLNTAVTGLSGLGSQVSSLMNELSGKKAELAVAQTTLEAYIAQIDQQVQAGALTPEAALEQYKSCYTQLGQVQGSLSVIDELTATLSQSGLDKLDMTTFQSSVAALSEGATNLCGGINQLYVGTQSLQSGLNELTQGGTALESGAKQLSAGITQVDTGASALKDGASQLVTGAAQLNSGASSLDSGAADLQTGAKKLDDGAADLKDGSKKLDTGAADLKDGAKKLDDGASDLKDGAKKLDQGAGDLKNGVNTLNEGAKSLDSGAASLKDGANQLNLGAATLYTGIVKVNDGALQLHTGSHTLDDGVATLLDGVITLDDGMNEFDRDGIQKLSDVYHDDLLPVKDRFHAIKDAGSNYNVFSDIAEGKSGTCKFIITTESISK